MKLNLLRYAAFCVLVGVLAITPAMAQTCPAGSSPFSGTLGDGADLWELEGSIASVDVTNRQITANGMTFNLPTGLLIDTGLSQGLTMSCWADPTITGCFPSGTVPTNPRSVLGGTVIAVGEADTTANPGCLTYNATSVFFEFAENVVVGALTSVTPSTSSLTVNGAAVTMNVDPRLPANIVDEAGQSLALSDLQGLEGEPMGAEGYYDASGVLNAVLVELDFIVATGTTDVIGINGAEWRGDKDELRVDGTVVPVGAMPATVTIYAPGVLDGSGGCLGASVGTTPVDGVDGSFDFRNRGGFPNDPGSVCVASPNGGAASSPTTAN